MSILQSIRVLNGLSKDIAFVERQKIAICWKFQHIFKRNTQKNQIQNFLG